MKVRVTVQKVMKLPEEFELVATREKMPDADIVVVKGEDIEKYADENTIPCLRDKQTGTLIDFELVPVYYRMVRRPPQPFGGTLGVKKFNPSEGEELGDAGDMAESFLIEELDNEDKVKRKIGWEIEHE